MPRRSVLAVLGAVLACALLPATAPAASPHVVSHLYRVSYQLSGDYTAATKYPDESQGYCAGTGLTETAHFNITFTAKLRVRLDGEAIAHKNLLAPTDPGSWKQEGIVVPEGSDCSATQPETCEGDLQLGDNPSVANALYARGRGHKVRFAFNLSGIPEENQNAQGCDGGNTPVPLFSLNPILKPYEETYFDVPIASLGARKSFSGNARPVVKVHGYSVETCDHAPACTGSLAHFVRKISVKQLS